MKIREIILEQKIKGWNDYSNDWKREWMSRNQIFYPGAYPYADISDETLRTPKITDGDRKRIENILDEILEENDISVKGITLKSDITDHLIWRAGHRRNFVAHPSEDELIKLCRMAIKEHAGEIKDLIKKFYNNVDDKYKDTIEEKLSKDIVDDEYEEDDEEDDEEDKRGDAPFQFVDMTYDPLKFSIAGRIKNLTNEEMKDKKYQGTLLIFRLTSLIRSNKFMQVGRAADVSGPSYKIIDDQALKQRWADRDRWLAEEKKRVEARKAAEKAGREARSKAAEEAEIKRYEDDIAEYNSILKMTVRTPENQSSRDKKKNKVRKKIKSSRKALVDRIKNLNDRIDEIFQKLDDASRETEQQLTQEFNELTDLRQSLVNLVWKSKEIRDFDKREQEILGIKP